MGVGLALNADDDAQMDNGKIRICRAAGKPRVG